VPALGAGKYIYVVVKSMPDDQFGDLGALRITYQCSTCGFYRRDIRNKLTDTTR
jgi:hypothetical protein